MNDAQVLHARSIARHVRVLATTLATRMSGIENMSDEWLLKSQLSVMETIFNEVPNQAAGISAVVFDMLPRLAGLTPFEELPPDNEREPEEPESVFPPESDHP